jgi:cell division protein FtsL
MAYYGNLALRPERAPEETVRKTQRESAKVVRRRQLPIGEKLLYLFTIAVVVIVATFIIFRYAEMYQMNGKLQKMNNQYDQTTLQIKEMQRQVEALSDPSRIKAMATAQGMVPIDQQQGFTVSSKDEHTAVAMRP